MKRVVLALLAVAMTCGDANGQDQPVSNYEHLKCYEQLIGTWEYDGPLQEASPVLGAKDSKMVVRISWKWILKENVLEMNWSIKLQDDTELSGKSLTGWDTAEGRIIAGGMSSMGAHNLSMATYDEATKTWTVESKGVDRQGRATTATVVNRLVDADTLEWQSKDRTGGDNTGDSPKYTFKPHTQRPQPDPKGSPGPSRQPRPSSRASVAADYVRRSPRIT